ncbi:hypothetical protein N7481_012560 [Penicillium waksmanii]|uniref:uncharacterized protein n=1 Tax=Penicillium waksmanii TaxID=69791 RepID=UPI0025467CF6|nr:uncharacterized protein N7481_012560 [Penicillium waksmanii]KAJ5965846.1 hypothetical protein N7481_012560 [Penicillium waksmanii]
MAEAHKPKPADQRPADEDEEVDEEEEEEEEENDTNKSQKEMSPAMNNTELKRVVSGSFQFTIQCQYGTMDSFKEIHSIGTKGQQFAHNRYYDEQGNELQRSVFHITAYSEDEEDEWPTRKYALLVLHAEGQFGLPIIFTSSIPIQGRPGRLSLGYVWNGQEQQFDADPFAIRIYVPEKMADTAEEDNFDSSFFDISEK